MASEIIPSTSASGKRYDLLTIPMASSSSRHKPIAALIGSDLRGFDRFAARLDNLLLDPTLKHLYDVFISTDARSLSCAESHGLLPHAHVRWYGESPDTSAAMLRAFGPLKTGVSPHHLHQWWRLEHAWKSMERREKARGEQYAVVIRLRSDLRLPVPLAVDFSQLVKQPEQLVMRGDWVFWGARSAVRAAILEYVVALPHFHRVGQRAYMPLPYRQMVRVGPTGLSAGMLGWLKFPKESPARRFGFAGGCVGSAACVVSHVQRHLNELEVFDASGAWAKMRPDELVSVRDGWWRWDGIPDNEKYFMFHVLNRSLVPVPMLDVQNRASPPDKRISFLGKANGLLLPERHHANCSCVCRV